MWGVAERPRRQIVNLDEAGSTPVVPPNDAAVAPGAGEPPKLAVAGSTPAAVARLEQFHKELMRGR